MLAVPLGGYLLSPIFRRPTEGSWIPVGKLERFAPDRPTRIDYTYDKEDGWMKTRVDRYAYVIPHPDGFVALSPICSHLGCSVGWNDDRKLFMCPCHGGVYDQQGKVVSGPPPRPLTRFETKVEDGKLFIRVT